MSAQDTAPAAALERRYRRLLRCYPPGHRQVHREEMLGVLLATARPGQRAPGARQTVNLVACGLAIRARRALSSLADEAWQDALAVVSLITPALMLVIAVVAVVVTNVRDTVDRRVAALVAPVLLVDAASIRFEFEGISTATVLLSLASLLFAVLVWPVAIASWRGRVRRSSHALPT
jgi:hypothetical protein